MIGRRLHDLVGAARDRAWRARHRRCVPILNRRPEFWEPADLDRVCRRCLRRMIDEEIARSRGWQ